MAYINQPPDLRQLFADLSDRLRKLETATRFTFPKLEWRTERRARLVVQTTALAPI